MSTKVCFKCKIDKPLDDFHVIKHVMMSGKIKQTVHSYCKECLVKSVKKRKTLKKVSK